SRDLFGGRTRARGGRTAGLRGSSRGARSTSALATGGHPRLRPRVARFRGDHLRLLRVLGVRSGGIRGGGARRRRGADRAGGGAATVAHARDRARTARR